MVSPYRWVAGCCRVLQGVVVFVKILVCILMNAASSCMEHFDGIAIPVCCSVLRYVAGCCRVLQGVAGCCRVLQGVAMFMEILLCILMNAASSCLECFDGVARQVCCWVLQDVAGCCRML